MTYSSAAFPYSAEVIIDPELESVVIILAYTDKHNPEHNLSAYIAPDLGSNFYRFRAGPHELLYCEVEKLKAREHTGTFVLWPFPNRVRDTQYSYKGQHYSLAGIRPSSDPNLIHGLVYDRPWSYEQPLADQQSASVTTFIEMEPGGRYYDAYPFPSRLALTYTLTSSGVTVSYMVQNKGEQTLPYGFALHPYFNVLSVREHTLATLPANSVMEADEKTLPTGRLLNVHSGMYAMFDLNQPVPINQLKLDHVYTNLPEACECWIDYLGSDLRLRISTSQDFTHAVIYTPAGKPYFCLENQTCSTDAVNLYQRGMQDIAHLLEVQPGETASGFIRYGVEDRQDR